MFKRVLLCYDGSEAGRRALKRGAELAILLGADVHVLAIVPSAIADAAVIAGAVGYPCLVADRTDYRQLLDESLAWLKERGVSAGGVLAAGDPLELIPDYANRLAIDLIVLGHYPQRSGGFWWSGPQRRANLSDRVNCCIFVAVSAERGPPAGAGS